MSTEKQAKQSKVLEGNNPYIVEYMFQHRPAMTDIRIGHGGEATDDEVWLSPAQALSLLEWLQQERETLERAATIQREQGR